MISNLYQNRIEWGKAVDFLLGLEIFNILDNIHLRPRGIVGFALVEEKSYLTHNQ